MRTWLKVVLGLLAAFVVLLVLNAIVVSNQTADAEKNVDGSELIETSSGTLQVLDEGNPDGPPIVLIHGYTASLSWFEELAPLLTTDHRVISVDLLGHGGSDKPASGYAITDQANAVAEALAELGVADATLVGHSLGATVVTAVAEQSPDLVARIVNIDQAPGEDYADLGFIDYVGYVPVLGQALNRASDVAPTSMVRSQFEIAFAPGFNIASGFENPDQVVDDLHEMTYTAFVDVVDAENDYTDSRSLDDRLGALEIPLLVIFGAEDQIYETEEAIEPYRDIAGVQAYVLEGAGHSPQVELPEETARLIEGFVAEGVAEEAAAAQKEAAAEKKASAKRQAARKKASAEKQAAAGKTAGEQGNTGEKEPAKPGKSGAAESKPQANGGKAK